MTQMAEAITHGELLARASRGDQAAWNALVETFGQMVWSIARSFRLDDATAKDVTQTVWLKLVENCDRIKDPERLPGWLATTCRREALKIARLRQRSIPTEFEYDLEDPSPALEAMLVEDEEVREVVTAFASLGRDCQQLLRLLATDPPLSYEEISEITGRPVGSLGPTRARCITRLKSAMGISNEGADSIEQGDKPK
jgi:RNA polymerase sigma factor (sigma-70 family)